MPDLEGMVKQAVENFSDDIIQALKETMKNILSADKVAKIDSSIAELFKPRKNNQILNMGYKGEQLFSNLPQLTWIKSNNPGIFTSDRGVTTYNELLDYAINVPIISIYKSSERRKTLIIEALKEIVGEETVNSYIDTRSNRSFAPAAPKIKDYRPISSTKMSNLGAASSDIVVRYPDGSVYFPTYQFSRDFLDWLENNTQASLKILYQRHHYFKGKKVSRYPGGKRTKDRFYFTVSARGVSVTEDVKDQTTVHVLEFQRGRYLLASEIRKIDSNGEEVFSRPADVFYEGGIKHKRWNPHEAMRMPKYRNLQ